MKIDIDMYPKNSESKFDIQFNNNDFINLDVVLARIIHNSLVEFKKRKNSYPSNMTMELWEKVLDSMIYSFEVISDDVNFYYDSDKEREVEKGLRLFGIHFRSLWT